MTPLQKYRHSLHEQGVELTLADAQKRRGEFLAALRRKYLGVGVPCPKDDDAMHRWFIDRMTREIQNRRMN